VPTTDTTKPIAVLGATGAQGGAVVRALSDAGHHVRAVARPSERLEALVADGVEAQPADLGDPVALERALTGVSGAFAHLPFVPVTELMERWATVLGGALNAAGVPVAVFSSSGPVPLEPTGVVTYDTKLAARRILDSSGASVVFLQPFTYLDNLLGPSVASGVVADGELRYPLPAEHRQLWISHADQAAMAIAALTRPDLAGNSYTIGQPLTGTELAAAIGSGLGMEVAYVPLEPAAFGRSLEVEMGAEIAEVVAADYELAGRRPPSVLFDAGGQDAARELGVSLTPVEVWARAAAWPRRSAARRGA
jgi:NAD(P)H dehydrogenase (quinone)